MGSIAIVTKNRFLNEFAVQTTVQRLTVHGGARD